MTEEIWQPVPFGDQYEVSTRGRCRNTKTGKFLTGTINEDGYIRVCLSENDRHKNFYLHVLVAQAFLESPSPGQQVRHWDGNPTNNDVSNLLYGTGSENVLDTVRYGNHVQARKTYCPQDHPYDEENTYNNPGGYRACRICVREAGRRYEERNRDERNRKKRERRAQASKSSQIETVTRAS
jgi:hypothetical protein